MSELKALVGKGFIFTGADGIEYECSPYDLNDLAQIEEDYGNIETLMVNVGPATQLRYMLWLSLRHRHPQMTIENAGKLIRTSEQKSMEEALNSFFLSENVGEEAATEEA